MLKGRGHPVTVPEKASWNQMQRGRRRGRKGAGRQEGRLLFYNGKTGVQNVSLRVTRNSSRGEAKEKLHQRDLSD